MENKYKSPLRDKKGVSDSIFLMELRPMTILGRTDGEYDTLIKAFLVFAFLGAMVLVLL